MGIYQRSSERNQTKKPYTRPAFTIFHPKAVQAKKLIQAFSIGPDQECEGSSRRCRGTKLLVGDEMELGRIGEITLICLRGSSTAANERHG